MTLEELQAKVAELTEAQEALTATNNGLKADLKKAKYELSKGQTIDPAEFSALQTENETLKSKLSEYDKTVKALTTERDKAVKTLESESKITIEMQRDRDLTEALSSINVTNPISLKAAKAMLAAQVQVVTEGDKRITKLGDKPLSEALKEWGATDEGKHFITAQNNNGGGSKGGSQSQNAKTMPRNEFDALPAKDRASKMADGYSLID